MRRREILQVFAFAALAPACKKAHAAFTCTDTSGLSFDETTARTTLAYADGAADPKRTCVRCTQWIPAKEDGTCGGCKVLKGPVHPNGTCKSFAAKG
jgi:hypothetical protein